MPFVQTPFQTINPYMYISGPKCVTRTPARASTLAGMAAAPPTMCVVGANDRLVDGDTKPSASVHTCGATVVRQIITNRHFKVSDFEALAPRMEGLLDRKSVV